MRYSWRWGPPLGGCKSFLKVLRTGMTNSVHDLGEKTAILKAFFVCSFWGAVTALLLAAPLNPWRSPISAIAVTAILLVAPQNEQRSPK